MEVHIHCRGHINKYCGDTDFLLDLQYNIRFSKNICGFRLEIHYNVTAQRIYAQ